MINQEDCKLADSYFKAREDANYAKHQQIIAKLLQHDSATYEKIINYYHKWKNISLLDKFYYYGYCSYMYLLKYIVKYFANYNNPNIFTKRSYMNKNIKFLYDHKHKTTYRLESLLGKGSMGEGPSEVIKAINITNQQPIAIKMVVYNSKLEEIILKKLNRYKGSLFIPTTTGIIKHCLIQELIPGKSLYKLANENVKFSNQEIINIVHRCFQQLDWLHQQGIFFVDIKSDNIMFDSIEQEINFVDFGMAELFEPLTNHPDNSRHINYKNMHFNGTDVVNNSVSNKEINQRCLQEIQQLKTMLTSFFNTANSSLNLKIHTEEFSIIKDSESCENHARINLNTHLKYL